MNDRLEDRLIDTLEHRAGEVTDASDMAARAVAVGRRARRRHRIVVVAVAASLVAAISVASAQVAQRSATGPAPSGPANRPTTPAEGVPNVKPTVVPAPSTATETGTRQSQARRITRCRDIPTDEPPQNHGTDTTLHPATGRIEIWYTVAGQNRHHTIDYRHDKTCADHRLLRKLINGVVATAIEDGVEAVPPPWELIPAEADHPAAGICGGNDGPVAILNVNPDTAAPRCLVVRPDQRLKVVNTTDRFGFTGSTVVVTFGPWPSRTLDVGESVTFDQPLGTVFAPGAHTVHLNFQGGYDGGAILVE
jgi:hypothetical protein